MAKKKKSAQLEVNLEYKLRMSFLYHASLYTAQSSSLLPMASFLGKEMKEVSKKILAKLHATVKRSFCLACHCPLLPESGTIYTRIKSLGIKRKKGNRKRHRMSRGIDENEHIMGKSRKKNRVLWVCQNCGYMRTLLTNPYSKTNTL